MAFSLEQSERLADLLMKEEALEKRHAIAVMAGHKIRHLFQDSRSLIRDEIEKLIVEY